MSKVTLLSIAEKFLEKEKTGHEYTEDKLIKQKFFFKLTEEEAPVTFDNESSVKCVITEENLNKAFTAKKIKKEANALYQIVVKKASFDVLFTTDIESKFVLRVVLHLDDFDVETIVKQDKDVPMNINAVNHVIALLKDLHSYYIMNKIMQSKFNESKVNASSFLNNKFDDIQNVLSFKAEAVYFFYKRRQYIKNPFLYTTIEKENPSSLAIHKELKNFDLKGTFLQNTNMKGVKELKPTKIDLSKIPSSYYDNEEVDEEYKPFLKQTSLTNPNSGLSKEMFLKHKRRRTNIPKPTKAPAVVQNLYNNYQNVLANITVGTVDRYLNMMKYKETISN